MKRLHMVSAFCAALICFNTTTSHAVGISGQGTWETTLVPRDLDGNPATVEAYYDTVLNITWLADANYAQTSGYDGDGYMDWNTANAWAAGLNLNNISGWRLPTITDTGTSGCDFAYTSTDCGYNVNISTSEMAHMFYSTLGDKAYCDTFGNCPQAGWGLINSGPFSNLQVAPYWSATEYYDTSTAWYFSFSNGWQNGDYIKFLLNSALAVHSGDVGAVIVPIPGAVWLFGSGLLGMLGAARRKTAF
jgi:hypothetical protein